MRKVWIARPRAAEYDDEEFRRLLGEAGCPAVGEIDLNIEALEALECEPDEVCLVLPLSADLEAETDLEGMLIVAERRGCSVVAVWPQGADNVTVPSAVTKHADHVIAWNPERLRECLEDAPPHYETPRGELRQRPETPPNKC